MIYPTKPFIFKCVENIVHVVPDYLQLLSYCVGIRTYFYLLQMSALIAKKNKIDIPRLIIALFMYLRVAFGLQLVMDSSKNRILAPNVQRTIAFIWFVLYMASTMITKKIELVTEIHFRNSLLMQALPTFMTATMCVSTVLTLLFTHYFANARKSLIKEVLNIDNTLEPKNIALDSKGAPLIAAIGIIQILYMIFWFVLSGPLDYYKDLTMFDRILTIIPRLVSTFFLLDYFTGVTILIQQFTKNNEALEVLRDKSLQVKNFPKDERLFQQQILDIADRHRKLSKIVKRTNGIYALQLLVNIAVIYAFILARTYMAIYVILSSFQSGFAIKMAAVCLVHLALNATTLLLLVEITSRLCQEVRCV